MRWMLVAALIAAALTVTAAQTSEHPSELKRGAGLDKVMAHCNACHSLDYIPMNAGFLDFAGWDAEVAKMIKAFGAPVDQADAKVIAEYLGTNYGSRPQLGGARPAEGSGLRRKSIIASPAPHAAPRRHPVARNPFEALFAAFAAASTCRPAKAEEHRAWAAACGSKPRRASDWGRREARLR